MITTNKKPATEKASFIHLWLRCRHLEKSQLFLKTVLRSVSLTKETWQLCPPGAVRLPASSLSLVNPHHFPSPAPSRWGTGQQGLGAPCPSSLGRQIPAGLLPRIQASRWLEFTVPKQYFAIPQEAKERTPDHHLSSFWVTVLIGIFILSCLASSWAWNNPGARGDCLASAMLTFTFKTPDTRSHSTPTCPWVPSPPKDKPMMCAQTRRAEGASKSWLAFSQLYAITSADLLLDKKHTG